LPSLVPAFLLSGVFAVAQAQDAGSSAAKPTKWSDPDSWPNHKVPVAGDKPTIGRDKDVILDVSPPALLGLSIDGKLTFSNDADLELTTEWIMLHGSSRLAAKRAPTRTRRRSPSPTPSRMKT
jgi:cell migration-inducing and hyaluronan-binding protein